MDIPKQDIPINFARGLDTKTDPRQVQIGKFLQLVNSVFTKAGLLVKRPGYPSLPALFDTSNTFLTTFSGNLTALGNSINAFAAGSNSWVKKGSFTPIALTVLPVGRSAVNQTQCDSVVAPNNFVCTTFAENNNGTFSYKYAVADSITGQYIVAPTLIPAGGGTLTQPRVFLVGNYFFIVFSNVLSAVEHLQFVAVSVSNPTIVTAPTDIASQYSGSTSTTPPAWDCVVNNNRLYVAYNTTVGGQQIKVTYVNTAFVVATPAAYSTQVGGEMSICVDTFSPTNPIFYIAFTSGSPLATGNGKVAAFDQNLNDIMTPTTIFTSLVTNNITCTALNGVCTVIYEIPSNYSYDSSIASNYLVSVTVARPTIIIPGTGTVGSTTTFIRSVGLASKAFIMDGTMYMLTAYDGKSSSAAAFQPTYFLVDINGNVVARLAYTNGGGYLTVSLPQAQVVGTNVYCAYLYKDLIAPVNKTLGLANAAGVYSQTGINLATFNFSSSLLATGELGNNLNLSGGYLYSYDGNTLCEQNFHLYPDSIEAAWSATGGSIHAQPDGATNTNAYAYQVYYKWVDARGNIHRSAPSIPIFVTTTGSGTAGSIVVQGPNLRLTGKFQVQIIIDRWSVAQEEFLSVTSITAPLLNSLTADSWSFTDTLADASIVGNELLYTTGGVVENDGTSACTDLAEWDTRLWTIMAEDGNVLAYSNKIVEGEPVQMSQELTIFVQPNAGTDQNTGPMKCIRPMDDKLVIFKKNALYYINGTGPDPTGNNDQYSEPIFITSTVGCSNSRSIVLIDKGLMFQSDKGIWLLNRQLATEYIGAAVEAFNSYTVSSAQVIPQTNYVLFTLSNGFMLMYDYYYGEWGTFQGNPAIGATIYNGLHTTINQYGGVNQAAPFSNLTYLDTGNPVLMSFLTGWIKIAGLQGYQRAFWFYFLGDYLSPHKLYAQVAYDYNPAPAQAFLIQPDNFPSQYGGTSPYGQDPVYGGTLSREQWRIDFAQQTCQAFQISMAEIYDPSFGIAAGPGFQLSGINAYVAAKKAYFPIKAANQGG